ncbi:beta-hydroxyacyl-ACP dehydratase [Micromonospora sp. FIMYZ51]|uniref:3-hydroxyacyl-ACP dehydratase FabZ family protein n=1 Tax=Micromonospora sp. FIMYZ51 TaxID=3051832 RepID=UPI00311EDDF4
MLDLPAIRRILPQRHPLLLIDRVLELEPGRRITAVKAISLAETCYAAIADEAPPQAYAYPVSLAIESIGQAAALLFMAATDRVLAADEMFVLGGIRDYRVHGRAYPGDVLRHEVVLDHAVADTIFAAGQTWVGDRRIATAKSLVAAVRPRVLLPSEPVP